MTCFVIIDRLLFRKHHAVKVSTHRSYDAFLLNEYRICHHINHPNITRASHWYASTSAEMSNQSSHAQLPAAQHGPGCRGI